MKYIQKPVEVEVERIGTTVLVQTDMGPYSAGPGDCKVIYPGGLVLVFKPGRLAALFSPASSAAPARPSAAPAAKTAKTADAPVASPRPSRRKRRW